MPSNVKNSCKLLVQNIHNKIGSMCYDHIYESNLDLNEDMNINSLDINIANDLNTTDDYCQTKLNGYSLNICIASLDYNWDNIYSTLDLSEYSKQIFANKRTNFDNIYLKNKFSESFSIKNFPKLLMYLKP